MADEQKKDRGFALSDMENEATYIDTLFKLKQRSREFCIQAIVEKYDKEKNIATVRPLIDYKKSGKRGTIDVPVMNFCHGGFVIHLPIFVGDTGWVIAGDRNGAKMMKKNAAILKEPMQKDDFGQEIAGKNFGSMKADDDGICQFAFGFFIPSCWAKKDSELVKDDKAITIASIDKSVTVEIGGEDVIRINKMKAQRLNLLTDVTFNEATHEMEKEFTEITGVFEVGNKNKQNVFTATPLSVELPEADDPKPEPEPKPEES